MLPKNHALPPIEHAIRLLVPSGRRAEIVALFDHRTTYGTIRGWRRGRRNPPAWAVQAIREATERVFEPIRRLAPGPGGNGVSGARQLREYHARRKEKVRQKADQDKT